MNEVVPPPLAGWESYYVIVGSSAAALTGLQFVGMALMGDTVKRASGEQIDAFGTPSIVHFCVALLTSAAWHAALPVVAYEALSGGAIAALWPEHEAWFVIGAATLLLVFIGIHNAWDTVTLLVVTRLRREDQQLEAPAPPT